MIIRDRLGYRQLRYADEKPYENPPDCFHFLLPFRMANGSGHPSRYAGRLVSQPAALSFARLICQSSFVFNTCRFRVLARWDCDQGVFIRSNAVVHDRPLKRTIQHLIQDPLALRILEGSIKEGDRVVADDQDGQIVFQ